MNLHLRCHFTGAPVADDNRVDPAYGAGVPATRGLGVAVAAE